jgi:IS30 family transposase
MGAEKSARDLHIATLAMQGVPIGEIAQRLHLHRNTVSRRLKRPETRQCLAALLQELAERTTTQTAERLEAVRQEAQQERARKRALRRGQGAPLLREHNPFDAYAPVRQYVAKQR